MQRDLDTGRRCGHCGEDISHRRVDAKWCAGSRCRVAALRAEKVEAGGYVDLNYHANFINLSERLLELGFLPAHECESKDAVEDALGDFIEEHLG